MLKNWFCPLSALLFITTLLPLDAVASPRITFAGNPCPHIEPGPWDGVPQDYRDHSKKPRLKNVEEHHFTSSVEQIRPGGGRSATVIDDINYTLRAFPNHHKALYAIMRYSWKYKGKEFGTVAPPECHFQRTLSIFNDDPVVHMLYGIYLHKAGNLKMALMEYQAAEQLEFNSSELSYNMGLLFTELKDYPNARKYAEKAYSAKYPLPGLRKKLMRLGEWLEAE